ncbi:hypothetical protein AWW66_10945 [Micromonospora rosaria]|uniref:Uncharacterized protein n=1 Tax=Micromonospora rosaria TaxID=47874 RepID=A0A136PTX3_9ACTN|nr:hypothetical protein [Micromonospora rosaria]KXK61950.1 hypothetical protein AWW66_10945 [Micromonospora rosaria]
MRNDLRAELYLGGTLGWVDVTEDVRQAVADSGGGITITRPEGDPGTMDLVFTNDGRYSPRNPRSPYYGVLGRNTPVRIGLVELADQFDRTVVSGWGPGWSWFGAGSPVVGTDMPVTGGTGIHRVPFVAGFRATYYTARRWRDAELRVTVSSPIADVTGGNIEPANLLLRGQDINTYYMARLEVSTAEVVTLTLHGPAGQIAGPVTVPGLRWTGQPLRVAASVVADRLAMSVWDPAAGGEPRDWQITAVDGRLAAAGWVGIRSGVGAGNSNSKPIEFRYDDLEVIDRRALMEVSAWPPRWTPEANGTDRGDTWVEVQAAGILERLGQGTKALTSPMYQTLIARDPAGYLPLEDGEKTRNPSNVARDAVRASATAVAFADRECPPGASSCARLTGSSSRLTIGVAGRSSSHWSVFVMFRLQSLPAAGQDWPFMSLRMAGSNVDRWELQLGQNGLRWAAYNSAGTELSSRVSLYGAGVDPLGWVAICLQVQQVGTLTTWGWVHHQVGSDVWYTGNGWAGDSFAGTVGQMIWGEVAAGSQFSGARLSHWAVDTRPIPLDSWQYRDASSGFAGELATDRIARLSAEVGVPMLITRGPDPSCPMGAQGPSDYLSLIRECAEADGGILGEAREQQALTYRALSSLYNQPPLAIDYARLAPPLEPTDDVDHVRNDVTVERTGGGRQRYVMPTGPLSVQRPPDGVGTYTTSYTLNLASDEQVADHARWRLHLGTWDEARYPRARVELGDPAWSTDPLLASEVVALDAGRVLALGGLPAWLPPGPTSQMVRATVERIDQHTRTLDWTLTPAGPYTVATVGGPQRVAPDASFTTGLTASGMSMLVTTSAADGPWTEDPQDFPLPMRVGGEQVTASSIERSMVDVFGRTVAAGGWGSPWTVARGSASNYSVAGGVGLIALPTVNDEHQATLDVGAQTQDIRAWVLAPATPAGGPINLGLLLRYTDQGTNYWIDAQVATDGSIAVRIIRREAGAVTVLGSATAAVTHSSTVPRAIRAEVAGNLIRARVWASNAAEPTAWDVQTTDPAPLPGATRAGIVARRMTGNTNGTLTVQIDNVSVVSPQLVTLSARGVNGVQRGWGAGTPVTVWTPAVVAL